MAISIANNLRDRKFNKTLVKHPKEATRKNQKAYITIFILYVNGVPYSVAALANPTEGDSEPEEELVIPRKNNIASATPTVRQIYSEEIEEIVRNTLNTSQNVTKPTNSTASNKIINCPTKNKEFRTLES